MSLYRPAKAFKVATLATSPGFCRLCRCLHWRHSGKMSLMSLMSLYSFLVGFVAARKPRTHRPRPLTRPSASVAALAPLAGRGAIESASNEDLIVPARR